MPARVYKSDPKALLAEGQELIKTIQDPRFRHRVEMVNLVLQGAPATFLSQGCKEDDSTISRWVRIVDEGGFAALCPKKRTGRQPRLGHQERASIQAVLEEDQPKKYGYCVWDGRSLSDYIQKRFPVQLGIRQCQRLLHQLGFSLVRPQTFPSKNEDNKDARGAFKKRWLN